ncbi:hypothetical protein QQZ08_010742 [Neonectria magnoliae]|uniref:BZIP domain-containing protein n=1 Tax=Neonectria magnoliae TaxID=2732573 RepID=A0ABR1HFD7_9HYPO
MDPNNQNLDCSGFYWDAGSGSAQPHDANVDPLFNQTPGCDEAATSPAWNYPLDQPFEFFDPNLADASASSVSPILVSTNSPYTRSQSRTAPSESAMGASYASSKSSFMSPHSPPPDKSQKPTRAKPPRQRQRTQRQRQASASRKQQSRQVVKLENDDAEIPNGENGDVKRDKFLQRNREAAYKCRQKKKEWTTQLEATRTKMEEKNKSLHNQVNGLVNEVSYIKNVLMVHAGCNDSKIDRWLQNQARKVVENSELAASSRGACDAGMCSHEHHRNNKRTLSLSGPPESPSLDTSYDYMPDSLFEG